MVTDLLTTAMVLGAYALFMAGLAFTFYDLWGR